MDFHDSEDRIQETILENTNDPDEREIFKRSTFTVIASGRVQVDGRDDHTKDTILRGISPRRAYQILPQNNYSPRRGKFVVIKKNKFWLEVAGVPSTYSLNKVTGNVKDIIFHRYHHRIVLKEAAIPYTSLCNLKDMVLVLEHCVEGIYMR